MNVAQSLKSGLGFGVSFAAVSVSLTSVAAAFGWPLTLPALAVSFAATYTFIRHAVRVQPKVGAYTVGIFAGAIMTAAVLRPVFNKAFERPAPKKPEKKIDMMIAAKKPARDKHTAVFHA